MRRSRLISLSFGQPAIFFRIFSTEPLVCPPIPNFKPHKPPKMSEPRTSKPSFYILLVAFVEYEPLDSLLLIIHKAKLEIVRSYIGSI